MTGDGVVGAAVVVVVVVVVGGLVVEGASVGAAVSVVVVVVAVVVAGAVTVKDTLRVPAKPAGAALISFTQTINLPNPSVVLFATATPRIVVLSLGE